MPPEFRGAQQVWEDPQERAASDDFRGQEGERGGYSENEMS